jgi:hypothetical protein
MCFDRACIRLIHPSEEALSRFIVHFAEDGYIGGYTRRDTVEFEILNTGLCGNVVWESITSTMLTLGLIRSGFNFMYVIFPDGLRKLYLLQLYHTEGIGGYQFRKITSWQMPSNTDLEESWRLVLESMQLPDGERELLSSRTE